MSLQLSNDEVTLLKRIVDKHIKSCKVSEMSFQSSEEDETFSEKDRAVFKEAREKYEAEKQLARALSTRLFLEKYDIQRAAQSMEFKP